MRFFRRFQLSAGLLLLTVPALAAAPNALPRQHRHGSVKRAGATGKKGKHAAHTAAVSMPPERATAIQSALIKQGYLSGEPTGAWDAPTVSAMEKLQADNGWQHKITPDSRALIKLGLGPNTDEEPNQEGHQAPPR